MMITMMMIPVLVVANSSYSSSLTAPNITSGC
jgi:hypothetical protein